MINQITEDIIDYELITDHVKKPGDNDVHVWEFNRWAYNEQLEYSHYLLNESEQCRAKRFRFREDHDLFVLGRYFTKIMLAHYTGNIHQNVNIDTDLYGKPTSGMNLFFNISHSGDQLLLGFSNTPIGVDIERNNPDVDIVKIAENHFSEAEIKQLMNSQGAVRADIFFEIWTKKEALIKGIGNGLSIPLQDFNVINSNEKVLWEFPTENNYGNWYVQNIDTKHGFKAAFATQNQIAKLSYFSLDNLKRY